MSALATVVGGKKKATILVVGVLVVFVAFQMLKTKIAGGDCGCS